MRQFIFDILALINITGWFADLICVVFFFVLLLMFIIINVMLIVWLERRASAFFQERLGPNRVGPQGLLQSVADVVKLLSKETITPVNVDRVVFWLAPILCFVPAVLMYPVLPFGKSLVMVNLNIGLLYIVAVSSTVIISIFMAGWGSNNKYSLLGGMRTVAQIISYEIPMVLSMFGIIMISGSLNLTEIINAQSKVWFIVLQPLAFFIFFISSIAELNRGPFDLPEAEQELVAGYHTEYSGIQFALFFLAEYANLFASCVLGATLFLGGYHGPFFDSWIWFLLKIYFLILMYMWVRWTFPRIRIDKMMKLNWKLLIPLSLFNIILTGFVLKFGLIYQLIVSIMQRS